MREGEWKLELHIYNHRTLRLQLLFFTLSNSQQSLLIPSHTVEQIHIPFARVLWVTNNTTSKVREATPWRKRLNVRFPPLRSRVRVSDTPRGFRGGRNGVWIGFCRDFSRFLLPQISFQHLFLHAHLIHFVLFNFIRPVMVHQGWSAGILAIHRPSIKGLLRISSLDRPSVGHELRYTVDLNRNFQQ